MNNATEYLYLIKTIEDNKVQLVTKVDTIDGVVMSEGKLCAVLKRYTPPVDMSEVLADIQKYSDIVPSIIRQRSKKRSGKVYTDHVGNEFETVFQLCAYYKVTETNYRSRLAKGWSQEEALTGVRKEKQVTDHLGNVFNSKADMCRHYEIRDALFDARIKAGKTVKEALLGVDEESEFTVEDHLGNKYKNVSEMCSAYGVRLDSYCHRKKRGWTLEEALVGRRNTEQVTDHKGNSFPDINEMCLEYGVQRNTYTRRINNGWTVEEALTGVKKDAVIYDHLGNMFLTQKDMCESYGIKLGTFRVRMRNGYTLEEALTTPVSKSSPSKGNKPKPVKPKPVTDHLGNEYPGKKEMCQAYGIRVGTFNQRIKSGKSLEEALTRTPSMITTNIPCQDHLGNCYNSQVEMARAYGLTKEQFIARKRQGWDVKRILTTPVNGNRKAVEFNGISYASMKELCKKNGLNYDAFVHRTNAGMSIEEAVAACQKSLLTEA